MTNSEQNERLPKEIGRYYEGGLERDRLSSPQGQLEFLRTQEIIRRYLPPAPCVVLDVGGGPGAYATWLAQEGYQVHLIDPVPLHLEQAKAASAAQPDAPIASISLGRAESLEFDDNYAEVVLMLGPLYHLTERSERVAALREARRVVISGGPIVAAGISRFASALDGLSKGYLQDEKFVEIVRRDLREGQHRNPTESPDYFTTAVFHYPDELAAELREAGFEVDAVLAVEGPAVFLGDLDDVWGDQDRRASILQLARWLEEEPAMLGATAHLAAIGRK